MKNPVNSIKTSRDVDICRMAPNCEAAAFNFFSSVVAVAVCRQYIKRKYNTIQNK